MQIYHFLCLYVVLATGAPVLYHYYVHEIVSPIHVALSFFLTLNILISVWEIALGFHIDYIRQDYLNLQKKYDKKRFDAVIDFFFRKVSLQDILSLKFWGRVWSTYSLYDPSYSNRESFGFFVDVGNGWTTLIPSFLYLIAMTRQQSFIPATALGIIGLVKFYKEFYGTVIYFLSFFFNNRHHGKSFMEVFLFVGVSNGLWFVFPLLGIYTSIHLIYNPQSGYSIFS